jgi:hypothetical protein
MLWDRGYWEPEGTKTPEQALAKGDFKFTLEGERLHGGFVLVRMANDRERGKRTNWLLIKHRDEFAAPARGAAVLEEAGPAPEATLFILPGSSEAAPPTVSAPRKSPRGEVSSLAQIERSSDAVELRRFAAAC